MDDQNGSKKLMTKDEFKAHIYTMKWHAKRYLNLLEQTLKLAQEDGAYKRLAEHDPELARLASEADSAGLEPLRRFVKYVTDRTEN